MFFFVSKPHFGSFHYNGDWAKNTTNSMAWLPCVRTDQQKLKHAPGLRRLTSMIELNGLNTQRELDLGASAATLKMPTLLQGVNLSAEKTGPCSSYVKQFNIWRELRWTQIKAAMTCGVGCMLDVELSSYCKSGPRIPGLRPAWFSSTRWKAAICSTGREI